jgi:hypothetical protein
MIYIYIYSPSRGFLTCKLFFFCKFAKGKCFSFGYQGS